MRTSDIRGIAQLATQGLVGVASIAEGMHQSVWRTLGVAGRGPQQTGGLTGRIYQGVRGGAQLLGQGLDSVLAGLQRRSSNSGDDTGTPQRDAMLAALNGVMGDRLAASGNPLASTMSLRHQGQAMDVLALPAGLHPTGKVLLLVHGLCMNDLQWQPQPQDGDAQQCDHGQALADALGYTPLYLRYNSGLHVSHNGRQLALLLEQLAAHWPVPLDHLSIIGHSMGGLLARSAVAFAQANGHHWQQQLKHLVFLGTPHHGAPLERAGSWLDLLLGSNRWSAPFARLGQLRSAGITDLRYGHVQDADWQGLGNRFRPHADQRQPLPLPSHVACYAVAATLAARRGSLADRLAGDGLVPLRSALGQHEAAQHRLKFAKDRQWIGFRLGHIGLLHSPDVTRQLLDWMSPAP